MSAAPLTQQGPVQVQEPPQCCQTGQPCCCPPQQHNIPPQQFNHGPTDYNPYNCPPPTHGMIDPNMNPGYYPPPPQMNSGYPPPPPPYSGNCGYNYGGYNNYPTPAAYPNTYPYPPPTAVYQNQPYLIYPNQASPYPQYQKLHNGAFMTPTGQVIVTQRRKRFSAGGWMCVLIIFLVFFPLCWVPFVIDSFYEEY
eukprot:TRINITY_DN14949_c0_g1_i1.p1 TRINITY_DN14949_c0_g1~~TRINITY_DN14949_c0_g1_i1.p1  ORF type:complete len:195 (-),score=26.68 TRINITY_DN14949_c0_g1_i1:103-687(-)